jgi:hypothetical protein
MTETTETTCKPETQLVMLTNEQLVMLDGCGDDKIQKMVDSAKRARSFVKNHDDLEPHIAEWLSDIIEEANKSGKLGFRNIRLQTPGKCPICQEKIGYAKYPRNGKYHRKGDINYKSPCSVAAIELAERFVSIKGHLVNGCCKKCWDSGMKDLVTANLIGVKAEIHKSITGEDLKYKCCRMMQCEECQWIGHEGKMGRMPAMMKGDYPGKCPSCEAKNLPFVPDKIKSISGYLAIVSIKTGEIVRHIGKPK